MASERGLQKMIDAAMSGVPAQVTYAEREEYARRMESRLEKGDVSEQKVREALTGFKAKMVEVLSVKVTQKGSPQDRANKADVQVKVSIRGLTNQNVNIQVKSSVGGMVEFLRFRYGDPKAISSWKKMAAQDLILLNGREGVEEIRHLFLIQLGRLLSYRTGERWEFVKDDLEAIVAKWGVTNTRAG